MKTEYNPWKEISLEDYENHMSLDSVHQLQTLNDMMRQQTNQYPVTSVMIFGIAGGNGLEHINPDKVKYVYGVDINANYLAECVRRYENLQDIFIPIQADLTNENISLPKADFVIANLLIEYIGYDSFLKAVDAVTPKYVSCIIQINTNDSFVSDSPYIHAFDELESVHHKVEEVELSRKMNDAGYHMVLHRQCDLPNGKQLLQLDFSYL